jgi:hypothetical protein
MAAMKNKAVDYLPIVGYIVLGLAVILLVILFFNVSARMTAIEQKQVVLENRIEVLRSDGFNSNR